VHPIYRTGYRYPTDVAFFMFFPTNISTECLNMLHTLRFSRQNAVYFIMLHFLVPVLFIFYIQMCQNLNVKLRCQKVNVCFL
jgi:hypothetical protein